MAESTQSLWGAVDPVVRKHYNVGKNIDAKAKSQFKKIFKATKGRESVRKSMEWGTPGQVGLKPENAAFDEFNIKHGSDKTILYAVYGGRMTLSMELVRDSKVKEIEKAAESIGESITCTPNYLAAGYLENAFDASEPATADGKALCSSSHLIIQTNASTGRNTLASGAALDETSLEAVMTSLRTTTMSNGMIQPLMGKKLVVPSGLHNLATKLNRSKNTLGSANNDPSVVNGIEVCTFDYLTDQNNWFVLTNKNEQDGLFWEWDIESQFEEDNSPSTWQKVYIGLFRSRWGVDDWRCIYGSEVS